MYLQVFGTVETVRGVAAATLSVDDDRPAEYMIQWYGTGINPGAILSTAEENGDTIELIPRWLYRVGSNGGLILPPLLTDEEVSGLKATHATLRKTDQGLEGNWTGPNMPSGAISFPKAPDILKGVKAVRCRSWAGFKSWAAERRSQDNAAWFRGHGCSSYSLRTSLHRAGRHRMDRYLATELVQFKSHVEAVFNRRFNLNDGDDYSTVLVLGQHHGLPTPMLDWTESPYIAAFFAFSDALDAKRAGKKSTHVRVFALSQKMIEGTSPRAVVVSWPQPFVASLTVAPLHNPRLYAQQGRFMVTNVSNLEAFIRNIEIKAGMQHLFAIDIPVACGTEALQDLAFMGLTAATMFPGLDGISRMIRHEMFYKKPLP